MSNYSFLRGQINYDRMEDPSYYEDSDVDEVEEIDEDDFDTEEELDRLDYLYEPLTDYEQRVNKLY